LARAQVRGLAVTATLAIVALSPGCSCGSAENACMLNSDCAGQCEAGTLPLCTDTGDCVCADNIPFGRTGQYSSMAVANSADVWVSAYNSTHGDLMVARFSGSGRIEKEAWEFVD